MPDDPKIQVAGYRLQGVPLNLENFFGIEKTSIIQT